MFLVLGAYHDEEHKEWAANNPEKVVERGSDGRIMQVTNYYTKGDLCGQHGSQRYELNVFGILIWNNNNFLKR